MIGLQQVASLVASPVQTILLNFVCSWDIYSNQTKQESETRDSGSCELFSEEGI